MKILKVQRIDARLFEICFLRFLQYKSLSIETSYFIFNHLREKLRFDKLSITL
jgi:hypothetical protein